MADPPKIPTGWRNTGNGLARITYEDGTESVEVPVGHCLEYWVDWGKGKPVIVREDGASDGK
jgi:hypothetical protein